MHTQIRLAALILIFTVFAAVLTAQQQASNGVTPPSPSSNIPSAAPAATPPQISDNLKFRIRDAQLNLTKLATETTKYWRDIGGEEASKKVSTLVIEAGKACGERYTFDSEKLTCVAKTK